MTCFFCLFSSAENWPRAEEDLSYDAFKLELWLQFQTLKTRVVRIKDILSRRPRSSKVCYELPDTLQTFVSYLLFNPFVEEQGVLQVLEGIGRIHPEGLIF